jgi:hypothetical protein
MPLVAGREQDGAHGGGHAEAGGGDEATHDVHRVEDRQAAGDHTARRVDVQHHLLVRILALEEEELGDDDVGDVVVDLGAEEDDAVLQQAAEDVPVALAAVGGMKALGRSSRARSRTDMTCERVSGNRLLIWPR